MIFGLSKIKNLPAPKMIGQKYHLTIDRAIRSTNAVTMLSTYTRQSYASVYNGKLEESIFQHI
jgi:hypothetical protein